MDAETNSDCCVALPIPSCEGCLAIGGPDVRADVYPGGPVLVRGARLVIDAAGVVSRAQRAVVAVCRCGRSRIGVFCDGSHRFASHPVRRKGGGVLPKRAARARS